MDPTQSSAGNAFKNSSWTPKRAEQGWTGHWGERLVALRVNLQAKEEEKLNPKCPRNLVDDNCLQNIDEEISRLKIRYRNQIVLSLRTECKHSE